MSKDQDEEPYAMSWPAAMTLIALFTLIGFVAWLIFK